MSCKLSLISEDAKKRPILKKENRYLLSIKKGENGTEKTGGRPPGFDVEWFLNWN